MTDREASRLLRKPPSQQQNGATGRALENARRHHAAGDLPKAESIYRQILQTENNHPDALHLLGLIAYQIGKNDVALNLITKALKSKPLFAKAHSNLGNVLKKMGQLERAVHHYHEAIAIEPDFADAHSNLGLTLCELGQPKEAIDICRKAITIKPDFLEAYCNLGVALKELGRLDEAVTVYRQTLDIEPDHVESHYNLGTLFQELERFEDAIASYDLVHSVFSRSKTLECLYALGRYEEFYQSLNKLIKGDKNNIRAAAISAFVSHQLCRPDPHPFCKKPLDFIRVYASPGKFGNDDQFLLRLADILETTTTTWEPTGKTTINGFQSPSNLFANPVGPLAELEIFIRDKINDYLRNFHTDDCDFIKLFPPKKTLSGWFVRLLKGGYQTEHIHPDGWLSGVFYLQVPKSDDKEEGSIEFSLWGYGYPILKDNYPKKRYYPQNGEIILFPSSLFHRTIPFHANENRICIPFDLIPT
ncbi:MAG TPA: tetratricopeptide repeat protein [Rhodospirillales bacterium]|nr:tetratricopeptide repeat protein [Rhodospirillales bacterium]